MNNSNYSLRFSRTAREAYGHEVSFHDHSRMDRVVLIVCAVLGAFVIGMMVGRAV